MACEPTDAQRSTNTSRPRSALPDRREIGGSDVAPAVGYSHGILVSGATRLLFLSCQVPVAPDGGVSPVLETQTRQVWSNIASHLAAADMTLDNVVKVTVVLADGAHRTVVNEVCDEVLGGRLLAWTTIVAGLVRDTWCLEIEVIAAG